jgi:hypothetical protein
VCVCSMEEAMVSFINKLAWFLRFPSTTCDALLALAPHRTKHAYVIALWLCRGVFMCVCVQADDMPSRGHHRLLPVSLIRLLVMGWGVSTVTLL